MVQQSFQFPFSAAIYRVTSLFRHLSVSYVSYVIYPYVSSNKTFSQIVSKNVSKMFFD